MKLFFFFCGCQSTRKMAKLRCGFFFTDRELAHMHIYINKGSVSVCGFCFFFFFDCVSLLPSLSCFVSVKLNRSDLNIMPTHLC